LFWSHSNTAMSWHSIYLSSPEKKLKLSSCNSQKPFTINMKYGSFVLAPILFLKT
jgi:hypothetical protein